MKVIEEEEELFLDDGIDLQNLFRNDQENEQLAVAENVILYIKLFGFKQILNLSCNSRLKMLTLLLTRLLMCKK